MAMNIQQELPQCPVCNSPGGYELSGVVGKFAKCPQCQAKWKIHTEKEKTIGLTLHELPKNGAALFKVEATNAPLFVQLGKPIAIGFWQNLKLDDKIDWEFLSKSVDPALLNCIIIDKSELVLNYWTGNRLVPNERYRAGPGPRAQPMMLQMGALLLTSRRLIWLERRQIGVWKPQINYQVAVDMPLETVKSVSAESGDSGDWEKMRKVSIVGSDGEKTFNLENAFQELLRPMVENAIKQRRDEIEAEKKRDKVHVMLDFSFLKSVMEKGGLMMQVLKCPECGASVEFPKSGNETTCTHCGKTIYAQDVFEKVKGLI
jgi:DNA-directed RNA polymerase subunit RPC12/RpoP